jgi:hypothetical protein
MSHSHYNTVLNPKTLIESSSLNTIDLLSSEYLIPDNQREYAWEASQLEKLFNDLSNAASTLRGQGQPRGHYMGALVVMRVADQQSQYRVLDGQQRLTSLLLLAAAMMDDAGRFEQETQFREILVNLLGPYTNAGRQIRVRLNYAGEFFESLISRPVSGQSRKEWLSARHRLGEVETNLKEGYETFRRLLNDHVPSLQALEDLRTSLLELLVFLRIIVSDERMAYSLFETLNNRAADLSQADLVKNELLSRAPEGEPRNNVATAWRELRDWVEIISIVDTTEMIHYSFLSRHFQIQRESLLDEGYKDHRVTAFSAEDLVCQLRDDASALHRIINGIDDWADAYRHVNDTVELMGVHFAIVPLIALETRAGGHAGEHVKLALAIRNFVFRFIKVQKNSIGSFTRLMSTVATELHRGDSVNDLIAKLKEQSPDQVFRESLEKISFSRSAEAFFAIRCIEEKIAGGAGIDVQDQSPNQHLEHVLPRRPRDNYPKFPQEERRHWLNRLGNHLILERDLNQRATNKPIQQKLEVYAKSVLRLPGEIEALLEDGGEWTPEMINTRQIALAANHWEAWKLT